MRKGSPKLRQSRRQSARRCQLRHGQRLAVLRAITAARLYASGFFPNLAVAAESCDSNVRYVSAAVTLLKAENTTLLNKALVDEVSFLPAAAAMKKLAQLVVAWRSASTTDLTGFRTVTGVTTDLSEHILTSTPSELVEAGRRLGPEHIWQQIVVPAMEPTPVTSAA